GRPGRSTEMRGHRRSRGPVACRPRRPTLAPAGGAGRRPAEGADAMRTTLGAGALVVILTGSGRLPAQAPELAWVRVREHAAGKPGDSCGEAVFRGRMWLSGGWFQSFEDPPRDVWSSADGATWQLATKASEFKHTDLPTSLVFKDRMWTMG